MANSCRETSFVEQHADELVAQQVRQNEQLVTNSQKILNWGGYVDFGFFVPSGDGSGYVREVTTDGIIHTIAGNGATGYSGDGGPATSAAFSQATAGIAVDTGGTIYITDVFNNVVRALRPAARE